MVKHIKIALKNSLWIIILVILQFIGIPINEFSYLRANCQYLQLTKINCNDHIGFGEFITFFNGDYWSYEGTPRWFYAYFSLFVNTFPSIIAFFVAALILLFLLNKNFRKLNAIVLSSIAFNLILYFTIFSLVVVIIRNLNSPLSGVWDDLNGLAPMAFGVVSLLIFVVRSVFIARKFNSDIKNRIG